MLTLLSIATRGARMPALCAAGIVLSLLLACSLASAGYIEDRGDTTVIHVTVFGLPDPSNTDTFNRGEVAAVRAFQERFPAMFAERYREKYKANPAKYGNHNWDKVEVELQQFSGIKVEGVENDLLAIAGGMAPDVLYLNFRRSDNYIQNRFLYPLDKPEDNYLTSMTQEEIDFRIHPKLMPVIHRKGPDGEKHVWALPYGGALGKVLLFRKDLFDAKGIPYPTADWTWDDLIAAAKKITDPAKGIDGMLLGRGKHESWYWVTFLWSAGGEVMVYNEEKDEWRCTFDGPEAAEALDFYTRLSAEKWTDAEGKVRRGYSSKDVENAYQKWDRGQIGMMMSYIDEKVFATINPEVTGMVPVPKGPTGKRGGELNSRMMSLFSEIKDPAVRDAAWEYMRFYESEDAVRIKTRIMVEGGLGRFVNPKYLRMFGYPEVERLAPKGWSETFNIAIATGRPEPYGRNSNVAYDLMTFPIQKAEQMAINDQLPSDKEARLEVLGQLLKEGCARANEEMIGLITPAERMKRRICAALVLVALVVTMILVFRKILQAFTPDSADMPKRKGLNLARYGWPMVLLIPAVGTILVWQYVPVLKGSQMAFYDYRLLGDSQWVGVDNFGDLLFNRYWWTAVWTSVRYSFLVLALTFLPPIVLAIMLQEVPRATLLFRTIYYLPAVISGLVTVLLWKQFYEPSETGSLNAVVMHIPAIVYLAVGLIILVLAVTFARRLLYHDMRVGAACFVAAGLLLLATCVTLAAPILFRSDETLMQSILLIPSRLFAVVPEPYRWLSNPKSAMLSCVIPMVWAGMGPGCLIYLAALKGIPDEYFEAAEIDGGNFMDRIIHVVFPILKPLITINFVGAFIASWYSGAGNILVMTGGGAGTEVVDLHIWFKAFTFLKFGPATAMAWVLGFMLIGFTLHQLRILSRLEFRTTGAKE